MKTRFAKLIGGAMAVAVTLSILTGLVPASAWDPLQNPLPLPLPTSDGTPTGLPLIFSEDFSGDGLGSIPADWKEITGKPVIDSSFCKVVSDTDNSGHSIQAVQISSVIAAAGAALNNAVAFVPTGSGSAAFSDMDNYILQADVKFIASTNANNNAAARYAGIIARCGGTQYNGGFYLADINYNNRSGIGTFNPYTVPVTDPLVQVGPGGTRSASQANAAPNWNTATPANNKYYTVRLELAGNKLTCSINGTTSCTWTDASGTYTRGTFGIITSGMAANITNIKVYAAPPTIYKPAFKTASTVKTTSSVTLVWDAAPASAGAAKYSVLMDGVEVYNGTGTTCTVSGLNPNTNYYNFTTKT